MLSIVIQTSTCILIIVLLSSTRLKMQPSFLHLTTKANLLAPNLKRCDLKILLPLLSTVICSSVFASELTSYDKVKDSLLSGENLRIVTDFNKCTNVKSCDLCSNVLIKSISVTTPTSANIDEKNTIVMQYQDDNMPEFKFDPVKYLYTISANDTVNINVNDVNNKYVYTQYNCKVGEGIKFYS